MDTINVKVIIGSTRENRFSEKPARYIFEELKKREGITAELLDLRDYPMPFFSDPVSPSLNASKFTNTVVGKWAAKIKEADAYIIVTPEYNHGYPAVLKNAMDWVYFEWAKKPVGFVSYGNAGGARGVEQLRLVSVELAMTPIRSAVHIPGPVFIAVRQAPLPVDPALFKPIREPRDRVEEMFSELTWWARVLKTARVS